MCCDNTWLAKQSLNLFGSWSLQLAASELEEAWDSNLIGPLIYFETNKGYVRVD